MQQLFVKDQRGRYRAATADEVTEHLRELVSARIVGRVIGSPADSVELLRECYAVATTECFGMVTLDNRHRVIKHAPMFHGTIDNTTVYPRVIVREALALNAAAVILFHNHPSGVAEPSDADRLITRRIRDALELIDVRLLDHFVIGGAAYVSLASRGML